MRVGKVQGRIKEIEQLETISQPHVAYAVYAWLIKPMVLFVEITIPDICDLLLATSRKDLHQNLIPALTGRPPCASLERDLLPFQPDLEGWA